MPFRFDLQILVTVRTRVTVLKASLFRFGLLLKILNIGKIGHILVADGDAFNVTLCHEVMMVFVLFVTTHCLQILKLNSMLFIKLTRIQ